VNTGALDGLQLESLKQRSERTHRAPWVALDVSEEVED
jgi:hypothetical protein